ncbi:MAG: ribose 5-phosphate isomerase B [Candidatus Melainabacteria bacterium]|nr:ribose 5-phosphate isomerase B [Candidatus Melainabacteria bacterium]MBI3309416.1 ribose 5-phosphate isomerase B [Candidatus Melainabacteria bacterium]
MEKHKIAIGADHAGFELKEKIKNVLSELNYEVVDFGTNSTDSVDYPLIAKSVASSVKNKDPEKGILICGTGIGMAIAANKVKGIIAANCYSIDTAKLARQHNNSNILALGGRITDFNIAKDIVKAWLETDFEGGRHQRRVQEIKDLEK